LIFFFVDTPSLLSAGINFGKYDDIPVEVSGDGAPLPLASWDGTFIILVRPASVFCISVISSSLVAPIDEDLGPVIENSIKLSGYTKPTPVQR
jgi:hypothetical protein